MSRSETALERSSRRAGRDLTDAVARFPASEPAAAVPPGPLSTAGHDGILDRLEDCAALWPRVERHRSRIRMILEHLERFPGETWQDRWLMFETEAGSDSLAWRTAIRPDCGTAVLEALNAAAGPLLALDVIRPSHRWLVAQRFGFLRALSLFRDPVGTTTLERALADSPASRVLASNGVLTLARIQAHTGKTLREITASDILDMTNQLPGRLVNLSRSGLNTTWPVLHQLGWIEHESHAMPSRRRRGQLTIDEMVDFYGIDSPCREPLANYLRIRSAGLDYVSLRSLASVLLGTFWGDINRHHPDQTSFVLTTAQFNSWRTRLRIRPDGKQRKDVHGIFFAVRAFYLDIGQWALEDPYWAGWAAPTTISFADTKGYTKSKRARVAQTHQRTRELAPVLPRLVVAAERELKAAEDALAAATTAGPGGNVELDGDPWTVFRRLPT